MLLLLLSLGCPVDSINAAVAKSKIAACVAATTETSQLLVGSYGKQLISLLSIRITSDFMPLLLVPSLLHCHYYLHHQ